MAEQSEQKQNGQYRHWRIAEDDQGIRWVYIDKADGSTNVFSQGVLEELDGVLGELEAAAQNGRLKGVVFASDKDNGFFAGADISMIQQLDETDDPVGLIRTSQTLFDRVEALPCPTVAAIHGFCLGGGLELAMACRYRVADRDSARLGQPEIQLGVHPGWGGTVRLPRLVGAPTAMDLMLTGRELRAERAKQTGLVDRLVGREQLADTARELIREQPPVHKPGLLARLSNWRLLSKPLAAQMRKQVAGRARREHYPAPYALIELWEQRPASDADKLRREAESFVSLARTETAKNLIRVFFLQEELKELGRRTSFEPRHVHVVGAGTMGGDIGAFSVYKGLSATLQDLDEERIQPALDRARKLYEKRLKKPDKVEEALDRLQADVEGSGAERADVIIEAIVEKLDVKRTVFAELESRAKADAVLATNTSSIPLDDIAASLERPERLVGIHFFNPVAQLPLVEVVSGERTDREQIDKATGYVGAIGKLPLPVKSSPGFMVNRVLMPYMMEATTLYAEGVSPTVIDRAATAFGMAMGPVELADSVGLDVGLSVAEVLTGAFGGEVPGELRKRVEAGDLGRKTGRGFYEYRDGKPVKPEAEMPDEATVRDITDRMIYRLLNEAVACLREGVVEKESHIDAGMIFGTGFAPFRGGPINHIRSQGVGECRRRLGELAERYGERFTPDAGWDQL